MTKLDIIKHTIYSIIENNYGDNDDIANELIEFIDFIIKDESFSRYFLDEYKHPHVI